MITMLDVEKEAKRNVGLREAMLSFSGLKERMRNIGDVTASPSAKASAANAVEHLEKAFVEVIHAYFHHLGMEVSDVHGT
jgi:hypothetical protein